jgi:HEAT repeat protein
MYQYFLIGSATRNGRRLTPLGTVAILLTFEEDRSSSPLIRAHAATASADLEADGKGPVPTGTVAILLKLLADGSSSQSSRAYAAKALAKLGAADALPTLRRLAQFSSNPEVRVAARKAWERISQETQPPPPSRSPGFWHRLESVLRYVFRHPCW